MFYSLWQNILQPQIGLQGMCNINNGGVWNHAADLLTT